MILNAYALNSVALNADGREYIAVGEVVNPSQSTTGLIGAAGGCLGDVTNTLHIVSASAENYTLMSAAIVDISDVVSGVMASGDFLFADCYNPQGVVSGVAKFLTFGNCINPSQTASGTFAIGQTFGVAIDGLMGEISSSFAFGSVLSAAVENEATDFYGVLNSGAVLNAGIVQPAPDVIGFAGVDGASILAPIQSVSAHVMNGAVGVGEVRGSAPHVDIQFNNQQLIVADIFNVPSIANATALHGAVCNAAIVNPAPIVRSECAVGAFIMGAVDNAFHEVYGEAYQNSEIHAAMIDSMDVVAASMSESVRESFVAFSTNVESMLSSRYPGFAALALGRVGGVYLAASNDGLYLLDGDSDDGADIDAVVRFGKEDFGSDQLKRVQYAYFGVDGNIGASMIVDGEVETGLHENTHGGAGLSTSRVKMGKGTKSRYWQPEIRSNGGPIMIDSMSMEPEITSRRVS